MANFGLTPQGFKRKQYTDIVSEMNLKARELFGENINLSERSFFGLLIRLVAWFLSLNWQLAEKVYFSGYPGTAEGVNLDSLGPYASIRRLKGIKARGSIIVEGEPFYLINKGFVVGTKNGTLFETVDNLELDENGNGEVDIIAIETGSQGNVDMGTITEIINPNPSVESVENLAPTTQGRLKETDAEFRARFDASAEGRGKATTAAIKSALLQVKEVRAANVIANETMSTVEGRPPKSVECFVLGGDDQDVAQAILNTKAAGIESYGQESETVQDVSGQAHLIKFTRASEVEVRIKATVSKGSKYLQDGDKLLKTVFIEHIGGLDEDGTIYTGLNVGEEVVLSKLISLAMHGVIGVDDISIELSTDDGASWSKENITTTITQVAQTAYGKIEVIDYV